MDRILVEVDDISAKRWRSATEEKKSELNGTISRLIEKALREDEESMSDFLTKVSKIAQANGLTEEILNKLLDED